MSPPACGSEPGNNVPNDGIHTAVIAGMARIIHLCPAASTAHDIKRWKNIEEKGTERINSRKISAGNITMTIPDALKIVKGVASHEETPFFNKTASLF